MKRVKLNEVADLKNGYAFRSKDYVESSNTLNCRMSNIRPDGKFDLEYNPRYLPDSFADKYDSFLLEDNDVIIAMTDMANEPKILGVPTLVKTKGNKVLLNQRVGKLTYDDKIISFGYLKYVLNTSFVKDYYKQFAGGGLQINLGKADLLSVEIPLPTLEEQKSIVAKLNRAQRLIDIDKAMLEKYDQLIQSVFLDMFGDPVTNPKGWDTKSLKSVTTKIGSGATPRGGKEAYKDDGISLIRSLNVYDNKFKYKNLAFIDDEQADKLSNVIVEEDDVLFNITGASVCRCCIVPKEILPARVNQHVSILRPIKEKLNSQFLMFCLISDNVKQNLLGIGEQGGATRQAITKTQLQKFELILPPIKIQKEFETIVTKVEDQKVLAESSLQKSEELFSSLVQEVFG